MTYCVQKEQEPVKLSGILIRILVAKPTEQIKLYHTIEKYCPTAIIAIGAFF